MVDIILKRCNFCEEWFTGDKVEDVWLERNPNSHPNHVYHCDSCLKKSKMERLTARAVKALDMGSFNEIEVTDGNLKVRLVRFTPSPYYASPIFPIPPY